MNYKVYQGTELKQTVMSKTAVINGLQPNQTYEFSVEPDNTQTVGGRTRCTHIAYANMKYVALEKSSFTLSERSTVRFGKDDKWVYKTFDAGTYTANSTTFGKDPYEGVVKRAEVVSDFYIGGGTNILTGSKGPFTPDCRPSNYDNGIYPNVIGYFEKGITYTISASSNGNFTDKHKVDTESDNIVLWLTNSTLDNDESKISYIVSSSTTGTTGTTFTFPFPSQYATVRINSYHKEPDMEVDHIKIEKGNVATPWSPAPSEANPTYVGTYTDLTQGGSTNPSDYTWIPIQDGDATRDGTKETISVTTRGIRFNIPKTLTVGSTITLRYEEYPLGIVPIGKEPSGYFGGENKQSLSAKVISTANGSSVVEVAGNVIDVGGENLLSNSIGKFQPNKSSTDNYIIYTNSTVYMTQGQQYTVHADASSGLVWSGTHDPSAENNNVVLWLTDSAVISKIISDSNTGTGTTFTWNNPSGTYYLRVNTYKSDNSGYAEKVKIEHGDIATPYAAFVDGDTFTAQQDGTFALFSEHKALYY